MSSVESDLRLVRKCYMSDGQPAVLSIAGLGRWTMLVGELTLVFHLLDLEVTSGAAASFASLRGNGNWVGH